MNIPLFDSWRLRSDPNNIILEREQGGRIQEQYFYTSIEAAVERFVSKKINRSEATDIETLISYIKTLQTRLNKALAPLKLEVVDSK